MARGTRASCAWLLFVSAATHQRAMDSRIPLLCSMASGERRVSRQAQDRSNGGFSQKSKRRGPDHGYSASYVQQRITSHYSINGELGHFFISSGICQLTMGACWKVSLGNGLIMGITFAPLQCWWLLRMCAAKYETPTFSERITCRLFGGLRGAHRGFASHSKRPVRIAASGYLQLECIKGRV